MSGAKEIEGLLGTSIEKLQTMVNVNTVVGDIISPGGGVHIIPISKVVCGLVAGGGDYAIGKEKDTTGFGGGSGATMSIKPMGFLVVRENVVQFVTLEENDAISKLVDIAPDIIAKIASFFEKGEATTEEMPAEEINEVVVDEVCEEIILETEIETETPANSIDEILDELVEEK